MLLKLIILGVVSLYVINISYDYIMAILDIIILHLRLAAIHLKIRMVSFVALGTPNPALQIGTTLYFVT